MKSALQRMLLACLTGVTAAVFAQDFSSDVQISPTYGPVFGATVVQPFTLMPCETTGTGLVIELAAPLIARCANIEMTVEGVTSRARHRSKPLIVTHVAIAIKRADFPAMTASIPLASISAYFVDAVYSGDLNGDGLADVAIDLSSHGNGLAAEKGGRLFILSTDKGYLYLSMKEVMRGSTLVRLGGNKSATLLLQRLVVTGNNTQSIHAKDGKNHTFFMFDLLEFDDKAVKGIRLANAVDVRFPFFTQFTVKPSATETTLLDGHAKRRLWRDPVNEIVSGKIVVH